MIDTSGLHPFVCSDFMECSTDRGAESNCGSSGVTWAGETVDDPARCFPRVLTVIR